MRDKKRIQRILGLIQMLWLNDHDLRFFQLIDNLKYQITGHSNVDLFYFEDDTLEEDLIHLVNKENIIGKK